MSTEIQDVKCVPKVLSAVDSDLLFPIGKQVLLMSIVIIWLIYGTVKRRWFNVLPYPVYLPQGPKSSEGTPTLYFIRVFYSQATAQFNLTRTKLKVQLSYTDKTTITVECEPEVLQNSLKYKTDSCCNFFVRSGNHVGQLDSIIISHDSNGSFFVEFVEIQRLDNDPKQQFLAEIGENILPERAAKPKKFTFEKPRDIDPDNDARPISTITLFEMVPFFILTIQVGSLMTLVLIDHQCTDPESGGCSRFSLLAIGSLVGVGVFIVWMIILYFYINVIRRGLYNNLGQDYCNVFRLLVMIGLVAVISETSFEIYKASKSYTFGKVNAGSNVLNCDQSYALTSVTAFFVFYILFGIMAPLYIIHRANYELLLATLEEQRKNDKPPPEKAPKPALPDSVLTDDTSTMTGKPKENTFSQPPLPPLPPLPPPMPLQQQPQPPPAQSSGKSLGMSFSRGLPPRKTTMTTSPISTNRTTGAYSSPARTNQPVSTTDDNCGGYAAQMMKLNKVKSISQYVLKKK